MGPHFDAGFNASLMLVQIIVRARAYNDRVGIMGAKCAGSDVLAGVPSGTLDQTAISTP